MPYGHARARAHTHTHAHAATDAHLATGLVNPVDDDRGRH